MLALYGVGFYLFGCKVFGDTSETNKGKSTALFYVRISKQSEVQRSNRKAVK